MREGNITCTFYLGWKKNTRRNRSFFQDEGRRGIATDPLLDEKHLLFHIVLKVNLPKGRGKMKLPHAQEEEADGCFRNHTKGIEKGGR